MFGLTAYAEIITGQFLLSLGALFYTGWWLTAFRPDARSGGALSALLFLLLAVFGLSGTAYGLTWAAVAAASLIAFTAYMMYYRMDDDTAYITGAVPLLVDGAVTLMIALLGR